MAWRDRLVERDRELLHAIVEELIGYEESEDLDDGGAYVKELTALKKKLEVA